MNRWILLLIHLVATHAENLVLRRIHEDDACHDIEEIKQQGLLYMEVVGRPSDIQTTHIHALEDALITYYDSASEKICDTGYRYLTGAEINRESIPTSSERQTFILEVKVVGACKGCSNLNFFSDTKRRRVKANKYQQRKLSSTKSSKKSSKKANYSMTDKCDCPAPTSKSITEALQSLIYDFLEINDVFERDVSPSLSSKGSKKSKSGTGSSEGETLEPTDIQTKTPEPTTSPVPEPTKKPSPVPTRTPQEEPTKAPQIKPSISPVGVLPTNQPSLRPTTKTPISEPSLAPIAPSPAPISEYCGPTQEPITYRSPSCDIENPTGYAICLEFLNMPCNSAPIFDSAIEFWEKAITTRIDDHNVRDDILENERFCGGGYNPPKPMSGLYICGKMLPIDGERKVLGTGSAIFFSGVPQPVKIGILKLDEADLDFLQESDQRFFDVILHEIGHVLGIGTAWRLSDKKLVNDDCEFTGPSATAKYRKRSGCTDRFPPVDCNSGHWAEECFDSELMTPARDVTGVTISEMTIASLEDIGYTIDLSKVQTDFTANDLDSSCRCNAASSGGVLWLWENEKQRERGQDSPNPELIKSAKEYASPSSFLGSDNKEILSRTTVLFREEGRLREVTV